MNYCIAECPNNCDTCVTGAGGAAVCTNCKKGYLYNSATGECSSEYQYCVRLCTYITVRYSTCGNNYLYCVMLYYLLNSA